MKIVQAVFGVFHHFELAHQLHRRGHLQRLYSTWPWARLKREGLPHSFVRTFPPLHTAEYLLGRTGYASPELLSRLAAWNTLAFDRYTLFQLPRDPTGNPDAFIAISGAGLLTGTEVQRRGGVFICDRGSTHQRIQDTLVREEYARWKLPPPLAKPHVLAREEAIYAQADAITVPSNVAKRSFIQMGVPADKVHVIPYGVRLDKFQPLTDSVGSGKFAAEFDPGILNEVPGNAPSQGAQSREPERLLPATTNRTSHLNPLPPANPNSFHLLFAGGVSLRKGVPHLLQAFAAVSHPRKHLTIAGRLSEEVRTLLPRLPTANVTFTGPLPQPELARLMASSHALILPSIEEGLALVQGQAMACGCPIIATAATGAEDLFTDGTGCSIPQAGFIIPATPENLANPVPVLTTHMQRLADDPALQKAMSSAALARVHQLGGWDHYGDLWQRLLQTLNQR